MRVTWGRRNGYEVSTQGDRRFSALVAKLGGRTIEEHYQCNIKGNPEVDFWKEYFDLWRRWSLENYHLIRDLYFRCGGRLCDRFSTGVVSQAHALACILNSVPIVVDIRKEPYDFYGGRSNGQHHFGNPFPSVELHNDWLNGEFPDVEPSRRKWVLENEKRLAGQRVGCFCYPQPCHLMNHVRRLLNAEDIHRSFLPAS